MAKRQKVDTKKTTIVSISAPTNRAINVLQKAVTPSSFKGAFRSAQNGEPGKLYSILSLFSKLDDEVISSMESLSSAVLGSGFKIVADTDAGDAGVSQAETMTELLNRLKLNDHLEQLLWFHFFGLSGIYVPADAWTVDTINGQLIQCPSYLEQIPDHWWYTKYADKQNKLYIGDTAQTDLPSGSVVTVSETPIPKHSSCDFTEYGKGIGALRHAIFKYYSEDDWSAFLEIFAQPLLIGKVGRGGTTETVQKAVTEIGHNSRAVIGENDEITAVEMAGNNGESFERRVQRANEAIAKILKCESLTNNQGKVGSYAASKTSNGIRLDVAQKIARKLTDAVYTDFIEPLCRRNFGKCLISINLPIKAASNKLDEIKALTEVGKLIPISANQVRSVSGAQAPVDEEDSINPRPQIGL